MYPITGRDLRDEKIALRIDRHLMRPPYISRLLGRLPELVQDLEGLALGLTDVGTLAEGKYAGFLVLNANPLDDILNTREISEVFLRGEKLDRDALLAKWQGANASQ